jgi:hypothetical protein
MRKFAELTHVHRSEPCEEYPGVWLSYVNGNQEKEFATFEEAYIDAAKRQYVTNELVITSVCWHCSHDDPRLGEVWFTGFYQVGRWTTLGTWKT